MKKYIFNIFVFFITSVYGAANNGGSTKDLSKLPPLSDTEIDISLKHLPQKAKDLIYDIQSGHLKGGMLLFTGHSGMGKTYAARAIGQRYYGENFTDLLSTFFLESRQSELNIQRQEKVLLPIIERATKCSQLVFIDGIECFARKFNRFESHALERSKTIGHMWRLLLQMKATNNIIIVGASPNCKTFADEWVRLFNQSNICVFDTVSEDHGRDLLIYNISKYANNITGSDISKIAEVIHRLSCKYGGCLSWFEHLVSAAHESVNFSQGEKKLNKQALINVIGEHERLLEVNLQDDYIDVEAFFNKHKKEIGVAVLGFGVLGTYICRSINKQSSK